MQQENGSQKVSRSAYRRSRRQMRRLRNRIVVAVLLAVIYLTLICVIEIDKTCGAVTQDLPDLPAAAQAMTTPAVEIEPEIPIYDIPLSEDLQKFTFEKCVQYGVDYIMVLAIMETESSYREDLIADGNYGLMQINRGNHKYLRDVLGTTDILDPRQNIEAGIFWLSGICQNYSDPNQILMVYNLGGAAARERMEAGQESTWYSRKVLTVMDEIKERRM